MSTLRGVASRQRQMSTSGIPVYRDLHFKNSNNYSYLSHNTALSLGPTQAANWIEIETKALPAGYRNVENKIEISNFQSSDQQRTDTTEHFLEVANNFTHAAIVNR